MRGYMFVGVGVCMRACVTVCVRVCVAVCVRVCVWQCGSAICLYLCV